MAFKHVFRRLAKTPLFTSVTVATLAIGIGANSAIFTVIDGILLHPLPYSHPEELISVSHPIPGLDFLSAGIAPFLYFTYREQGRALQYVGMWRTNSASVTGLTVPEQIDVADMTSEVLPALGTQPLLGRWLSPADDSPGARLGVVLLHPYWQARFGGDRSIIGRQIVVDGQPAEIVGVMRRQFRFLDLHPSLIRPLRLDRNNVVLGNFQYRGLARLKPGVTPNQALADLARLVPIAIHSFPPMPGTSTNWEHSGLAPNIHPLKDDVIGDIGKTLWVIIATIGMVLLIACANVANLLLVRAEGRRQELAVRAALGAGWLRIARELLAESLTLGLMGGIAGLGFAYGALRIVLAAAPANLPRVDQISIGPSVWLFTLGISLLAGLLFGAIPVFKNARQEAAGALRGGGRSMSESRERHRARGVLVVVQVGLAVVLLIGSGLMIRTFQALRNVQPGFTDPAAVQTFRATIPRTAARDPLAVAHIEKSILDNIQAIPGVSSVGSASVLPMDGGHWLDPIETRDHPDVLGKALKMRLFKFVSPGLLNAMGNRLVAGRDFTWVDAFELHPAAMVSENLARELWREPSAAIGKQIRERKNSPWREVIGVVADEREDGVDQPAPAMVYWPVPAGNFVGNPVFAEASMTYVVRSNRAGTSALLNDIQQAVWSVNADMPLAAVRTLQEIYSKSLARTAFTLLLLGIAGGMALLIGLVGIYGVISYSVAQRTREIGIRVALGARRQEVTRMFVVHGLTLAGIGIVCGLAAAASLSQIMASLLFEVRSTDPATYAAVSFLLLVSAVLASAIPALKATSVDPADALRSE
jgi:predicted permease